MKFFDWLHWKGGRQQVPAQVQHVARVLLGQLQEQMARSGIKTGSRTVTFPDGSSLSVAFLYGMAQVRFTPVGAPAKPPKFAMAYAYVNVYAEGVINNAVVAVVLLGKYRLLDEKTYVAESENFLLKESIVIGPRADLVNITTAYDGSAVFVNSYFSANAAVSDRVFFIDPTDNTLSREVNFLGGASPDLPGGNLCSTSANLKLYAGAALGSAASAQDRAAVIAFDDTATVPLSMIQGALTNEGSTYAAAATPDGRYVFLSSIFNPPSATARVAVVDTQTDLPVAYIDVYGKGELAAVVNCEAINDLLVSPDGTRLYVVGDSEGESILLRFVARLDLAFDTAGVFVSATMNGQISGAGSRRMAITPDGSELFVTDTDNDFITVYQTDQMPGMNNLVSDDGATVLTHPGRRSITAYKQEAMFTPGGIGITPDGKRILFPAGENPTTAVENRLYLYDAASGAEVDYITLPGYPTNVAVVLRPLME